MDYTVTDKQIVIHDNLNKTVWRMPRKKITSIDGDVAERWVINCRVPYDLVRHIVPMGQLEPLAINGHYVLSLCVLFMRHAAPCWAPLPKGPRSDNCALQIACMDKRNGEPVTWVDQRYTDSKYAKLVNLLGFPPVKKGLARVGSYEAQGMRLRTGDGGIDCIIAEGENCWEDAFGSVENFEEYFNAQARMYGPSLDPKLAHIVDLEKRSDNRFQFCKNYGGYLQTREGLWPVDSVYRTVDGLYRWTHHGQELIQPIHKQDECLAS